MVHALRQARRVLKPDGVLIDLRPDIRYFRAGILAAGRYRYLGIIRDRFDGARAANRALTQSLAQGVLRQASRTRFEIDLVLRSPAAFREWIAEFTDRGDLPEHERLVQQADRALRRRPGEAVIVVRLRLVMRVLVRGTARRTAARSARSARQPRPGPSLTRRPSSTVRGKRGALRA